MTECINNIIYNEKKLTEKNIIIPSNFLTLIVSMTLASEILHHINSNFSRLCYYMFWKSELFVKKIAERLYSFLDVNFHFV